MAEQQIPIDYAAQDNASYLFEVAGRYTEALERCFGDRLVSVVLYGSVARGDQTAMSDVDLRLSLPVGCRDRAGHGTGF